jgi:serine/threonine protein kinase
MSIDEFILHKKYEDSFTEIYKGIKKGSNNFFSITKINKEYLERKEGFFNIIKEGMDSLKDINHPNIIKLIKIIEDTKKYYYICEYYCDDNLNDYLKKAKEPLSEEIVQYIMKQVVSAVKYLHDKKIVHREITLTNLFIKYNSEEDLLNKNILNSKIILGGFNLSKYLKKGNNLNNFVVTKYYLAPEIDSIIHIYNEKVDIWSLGICCFALLYGKFPFYPKDYNNRMKYDLKTPLSKEANSFIDCMLEIDPKKRFSAFELSKHEFLNKKYGI